MDSKFKKAVGPVVAISLLMVVTVVSVVTFGSWYTTFSGDLSVKTEQNDATGINIGTVKLESNQLTFYAVSPENSFNVINSVEVNGVSCNMVGSDVVDDSMTEVALDCSGSKGENDLLVVTNSGAYTYEFYI